MKKSNLPQGAIQADSFSMSYDELYPKIYQRITVGDEPFYMQLKANGECNEGFY